MIRRRRRARVGRRFADSDQGLAVERKQTAPGFFGLSLVVDLRIGRAPAVRRRVDLDLRGQLRLGEGVLRAFFSSGDRVSSFSAISMRNCALVFAACRCGLFGVSVASPPPWNEATAPTRSGTAAAVQTRSGRPCSTPACPSPVFARPTVVNQPGDERPASVICVVSFRPCASGLTSAIGVFAPASRGRRFLDAIERIHHEHRVAGFGQPLAHLAERRTRTEDVRPYENAGSRAARRVHEVAVGGAVGVVTVTSVSVLRLR